MGPFFRVVAAVKGHTKTDRGVRLDALLPWIDSSGYHQVALHGGNGNRLVHVHTLVLTVFVGPRPDGMECRHLDGSRTNNHVTNLAWGTKIEKHDRILHDTSSKGEKNGCAKLTADNVLQIRQRRANGETYRIIATDFHVSICNIFNIVRRNTWKHI